MSLKKLNTMHMEDLLSTEVHSIDQGSWRHPHDDGGHVLKALDGSVVMLSMRLAIL
jgi:hypothetical protein